ncbi:hypothetical protein QBC34DRAFT_423557 [Podospora aff. communis PSN243]|uniref:Uncharacterized protein n=1 Tax=Podospora aff. communis PSN243 TaxID=3040156 RepID=A0AAV9GUY8_9PEZI|nr:hypothetical protein QBC34DRAFT_423557 [Podospora aff. communis PSN243]
MDTEHVNPEHATSRPRCLFKRLGWSIAAPRCLPRSIEFSPSGQAAAPISRTLNNPSAYLIDSGLWTACKESLEVIDKEFRKPAWRLASQRSPLTASQIESFRKSELLDIGRFDNPEVITYAASDRRERRYLTVRPEQDLFILQSHDILAIDWNILMDCPPPIATFLTRVGVKERQENGKRSLLTTRVTLPCNTTPGGIIFATAGAGRMTLWFIDDRIKRSPGYKKDPRAENTALAPPREFYASDRRFVEVRASEIGCHASHGRMWDVVGCACPTEDECLDCRCSSFEFVDGLASELEDKAGFNSITGIDIDIEWIAYGLLACEDI